MNGKKVYLYNFQICLYIRTNDKTITHLKNMILYNIDYEMVEEDVF